MQNIPMFTSEFGVASLILKEIPYSGTAYIRIQSSLSVDTLLEECVSFCRVVGAERIYATGHDDLGKFPIHTKVLQMEIIGEDLPCGNDELVPVVEENLEEWQRIYNEKMSGVDNASYMTLREVKQMVQKRQGWFVVAGGEVVAIAMAEPGKLHAVASVLPGGGRIALSVLRKILGDGPVSLEVASTNTRAIRLYEDLGFQQTEELSCWYKII